MRYQGICFDYDDTLVASTPEIHYPSWVETLAVLRPGLTMSYDEFATYCFRPGFAELLHDIIRFTPEEMVKQDRIWRKWADAIVPDFFPGIPELLTRLDEARIPWFIVSHSDPRQIEQAFRAKTRLTPQAIYGWDADPHKRKPSPYPLEEGCARFGLSPQDVVVIDDLLPGKVMADAAGASFIASGWGQDVPAIRAAMIADAPCYCESVTSLESLLFS